MAGNALSTSPAGSECSDGAAYNEKSPLVAKSETPIDTTWIKIFVACGALFTGGVSMFVFVEGWGFSTAVYACVQIITTIGYGDFTIQHDSTKIFFSFYILAGLTMAVFIANTFGEQLADKHRDMLVSRLTKVEETFRKTITERSDHSRDEILPAVDSREDIEDVAETGEAHDKLKLQASIRKTQIATQLVVNDTTDKLKEFLNRYNRLLVAIVPMLMDICFGTIFYATYEACTCSYGLTKVSGCREDTYSMCVETGGYVKTWVSAFYMSVMTVSTVGIGDYSPRSYFGRAVASVWMFIGVVTFAHGIKELSIFFFEQSRAFHLGKKDVVVDRKTFNDMDKDGNGMLSRAEFRGFFLVKHGLVSQDNLDQIDKYYDLIDVEGTNSISYDCMVSAGMGARKKQKAARDGIQPSPSSVGSSAV